MTSGPPAAWYADPGGSGGLRYWDGSSWTEHVTAPQLPSHGAATGYSPSGVALAGSAPKGRKVWPLFVVIGVLFVVAVVVGLVRAVPKVVDAGARFSDEAAQSSAHLAADAATELYALEGSYLGATPDRLEQTEAGLSYTDGPSTDFTTVSVQAGETRFVAAVNSLSNRCYVVIIDDEIGGPRTTGRLAEGMPCWASFAADQPLEPVEDF